MAAAALLGGCLCGAVRFRIVPPMRDMIACHCRQCRKSSGHYVAATSVALQQFELLESRGLRWFRSSVTARRGFCGECGSTLLWQPERGERISIFAGALDNSADLRLVAHIYAADKGDYYNIVAEDGVEVHEGGGVRLTP